MPTHIASINYGCDQYSTFIFSTCKAVYMYSYTQTSWPELISHQCNYYPCCFFGLALFTLTVFYFLHACNMYVRTYIYAHTYIFMCTYHKCANSPTLNHQFIHGPGTTRRRWESKSSHDLACVLHKYRWLTTHVHGSIINSLYMYVALHTNN